MALDSVLGEPVEEGAHILGSTIEQRPKYVQLAGQVAQVVRDPLERDCVKLAREQELSTDARAAATVVFRIVGLDEWTILLVHLVGPGRTPSG